MISDWIETAAACGGGAVYLEEAGGAGKLTFAGLQRSTSAMAGYLDRAGIPPGGRVAIRLPDPLGYATALVAILARGASRSRSIPVRPPQHWTGCSAWPGRRRSSVTAGRAFRRG